MIAVYLFFQILTRSNNNLQTKNMRMLIVLIVMLLCGFKCTFTSRPHQEPQFLIFSNDGKFYKLDPGQQHVHWQSDLGFKLIYFELSESQTHFENQLSTYFIPTVQGHFVYIDKNKQILVHRQQIQPLLKICFGKNSESKQLTPSPKQQYFLHQKYQYFFIDLKNGHIWNIENFFQQKIVIKQDRHALIKVSKKFIKQLKSDFSVKWSVISSTIDIVSATEFLKDPKKQIHTKFARQSNFQFRRISNHQLEVFNVQLEKSFQMGGKSPIMAVFSHIKNKTEFYKHPLDFYKKTILAIEDKHEDKINDIKSHLNKASVDIFPHTSQYKNANKINKQDTQKSNYQQQFDFQYCLNTFRAIQQLNSQASAQTNVPFTKNRLPIYQNGEWTNIQGKIYPPTQQISPISHPHLYYEPSRSQQQPLIWIFIIGSLILSGIGVYKFKVNKLLSELQKMETIHDKKFEEIQKKLGQFEEMQKMYEVYWDKLIYRKPRRKSSDNFESQSQVQGQIMNKTPKFMHQIQIYEHFIFQGRFLNKESLVYAVPMQGIDLIHVEHQLNDLLSCSHKSLVKLYYYTKNSQFLLIFCEKIEPLWNSIQDSNFLMKFSCKQTQTTFKSIQNTVFTKISGNEQKSIKTQQKIRWNFKDKKVQKINKQDKSLTKVIKQIIECFGYLDSRIQIFSLPLECIILNERTIIGSEKELDKGVANQFGNFQFQLKINAIPSILQVYKNEDDLTQESKLKCKHNMKIKLRHDLVKIFFFINNKGQKANIKELYSMVSKQDGSEEQEFFVRDFYDFVLNENYSFTIQMDSKDQNESKEEDKKIMRKFGANYQFLNHLLFHPFLWDSKRKMMFLSDFSNYIETYLDDYKIKKLQSYARDYQIVDTPWTKHLEPSFVRQVNQFRKYDFNSVRDLIRLIRNKVNHFHEIPRQTRNSIGKTPEAFIQYMLKLYPKLLSFAFVYAKRKKWKLHVQIK